MFHDPKNILFFLHFFGKIKTIINKIKQIIINEINKFDFFVVTINLSLVLFVNNSFLSLPITDTARIFKRKKIKFYVLKIIKPARPTAFSTLQYLLRALEIKRNKNIYTSSFFLKKGD